MAAKDDGPWYKDAIIYYELRVRSFYDSNGDGIGDFEGAYRETRLPEGPWGRYPVAGAQRWPSDCRRRPFP
jgi:hypothetical protein